MVSYKDRHDAFEAILTEMIQLLPSSYNKEVNDTNYYKLLRALSGELADAKVEINQIKDNTYLDTVSPDSMYNNFGVLIKLQKDSSWSDEKYRSLIKGVTQSLLKGPTKQSLVDGFKLFTNFKVNIYELYKDSDKVDPSAYSGYNPMFTFALEVEKPVDEYVDQEALIKDANYIVNIIKPAHTLSINIITIVGDETYRDYYRIDKNLSNQVQTVFDYKILTLLNSKLEQSFFDEAKDYSFQNSVSFDKAVDVLRNQSNGMTQAAYDQLIRTTAENSLQQYLANSSPYNPVRPCTVDDFIEYAKQQYRGTLETQYYEELKDKAFATATSTLTNTDIHYQIINMQNELINQWTSIGNDSSQKSSQEWFNEGLDAVKEQYLNDSLINELGGKDVLWQNCTTIVEPFRTILQNSIQKNDPYYGMDQMESDATLDNYEGSYGWKSTNYNLQLTTSLDPNVSRIGGARLIGPRYTLDDIDSTDIYLQQEDSIVPKFTNDGQLQNFGEDDHFLLMQHNLEEMPLPCDHNTHMIVETTENPFPQPNDQEHFNFQQNFNEVTDFLQVTASTEPDHIDEMGVEWDTETFNAPTDVIDSELDIDDTENYLTPVEDDDIEIDLDNESEQHAWITADYMMLNVDSLNDGYLNGYEQDEFEMTMFTVDSNGNQTITKLASWGI